MDEKNVTEEDFSSQFLAPQSSLKTNRADASLVRAQILNPMVELSVDTETLASKDDAFFKEFDVICIIGAPTEQLLRINEICRKENVKFFAADLWGMFGYSFADLQEHHFVE